MKVSFEGIGESVVTFFNSDVNGVKAAGVPVKMSGNGEVAGCGDGDRFFGVSIYRDDGFASIQNGGYVEMAYSGADPAAGYANLLANGAGGVKKGAAGSEFLIIGVDTVNKTLGFML